MYKLRIRCIVIVLLLVGCQQVGRGNGETWACGTGACAAVIAAVWNGYCEKDTDITVKAIGGDLIVRYAADDKGI